MRRFYQLMASTFLLVFSSNLSFSQVTADFTANVTQGCGSLQVSFSDLSSSTAGNIVSWDWDMGGVSSGVQNPGRIFNNPGQYTICLTVEDSEGNTGTECKTDYITVFNLPLPDFTADPEAGCISLDVNFIDQSTTENGEIVQWIWGLGGTGGVVVDDGTLPSITSTYNAPDSYTISLTITDEEGCINTITKDDYVLAAAPPVVDFSADATFSCNAPFIVNFANNGNVNNMSFYWDFGNNTFSTLANPDPVVYTTLGSHTVKLIGTDTISGCVDSLILNDYIQIGSPAEFSTSVTELCLGEGVAFTDLSVDPANGVIWDFGDGDSTTFGAPFHYYDTPGCYTVTLTRLVNGCTAFATSQTCIEVFPAPEVGYTNDNSLGCTTPHAVQFTSISPSAISWEWSFGEGPFTSTDENPIHTYTSNGTFPVTLTVTNAQGCTATVDTSVIIVQPIQALIPIDTTEGCVPLDVSLTSISNSPVPITSWEWQIIDSNATPPIIATSLLENPDFTLVDTGIYDIKLIVTNEIGCADSSYYEELITAGMPPVMGFDVSPPISCVETPITFTGQTSDYTDDWFWEFGDTGFGYGQSPEHEYLDTGYFDVTLYAYHHGCENELTLDSVIYIAPPIAGLAIDRFCNNPFYVEMVDISIGADSIFYDFGVDGVDTDTSSVANASFTYPATGDYTITMTVFNFETGCEDDLTRYIRIRDLDADFNVNSPLIGCVPMTISLEDLSQDVDTYSWSASGGAFSDPASAEPTLLLTTPGKYTDIELITTDVNGCQDTLIFQDTIFANGLLNDFVIDPPTGCRPLTVSFTDNSSSFFGNIIQWDWEFGGGAPNVSEQNPTAVFNDIGAYDIRLTLLDDWGCSRTRLVTAGVETTYPLVSFEADTLSCTSQSVSFVNNSNGHTLSYLWDFGDNTISTDPNPSHLYSNEGVYSVCLTATDINGCDSTFCRTDYIVIGDPVAAFSADSTAATCPPLIVNFQNESLNANQFTWEFGDNSGTSSLENPPHVYTDPGSYDLTLVASANGFCPDTLFIPDYINVEGPVGSFSFDIDSACIPAVITFYGESIDFYNYIWDFGNGEVDSTLNVMTDTVQYEYDMVGKIVPRLILEDFNACKRAFESPDTIYLEELMLDFAVTDSVLCTGEDNTTFINLTNSSIPVNNVEWIFDGGNPGTSNLTEPTITYDNPGTFDVTLISSNGFCTDTLFQPAVVKVGEEPVAAFSMSDTLGCFPFTVSFTDISTVNTGYIAEWDWTYEDGDSSSFQNPTHVFNDQGTADITLVVTTDIGCTDEVTNTIETYTLPEVQTPDPYNICMGSTAQLGVEILSDTSNLTYYWVPDPTLSCSNCFSPIATPMDTTIYYFVVNNAIGCADTSEVVVEVRPFPAPEIDITEDTTICANTIIQIVANGGTNVYEYQWDTSSPGLSCYENCFNPIASPEVLTTYTVTVTNEFACSAISEVTIDVIDESQPFAGSDRTICRGEGTQLSLDFGNNPTWHNTEGLSCTYCPDPFANPNVTTAYVVSIFTDSGCEIFDTIVVNVMTEGDFSAGTDNVICLGEEITLDGFGRGDILWTPDNSLNLNNIINPIASPTETTTYQITITNDECVLTDSVTIEVVDRAEVFAESETICIGENVELEAYGFIESVEWSPAATLSDSTIFNPIASPSETTTYVVTGSLGTCQDDTAHVTVNVIAGPETLLNPVYDFFQGQTIEVEVNTTELAAYTYAWSPIDLVSCVSCNNPQIAVDSTTNFAVTVTDPETGCWSIDSTMLRLRNTCPEDLIGVPNVFTPNEDGMNDKLGLHLTPAIQETGITMFRIFDRWGALIFETTDASDAWDGTYKGKKMPAGVYVYYLEAPCPVAEGTIMKKGDITLLK